MKRTADGRPFQLPARRLREPVGVPRRTERRRDPGFHPRLLQHLAHGADFGRLACFDVSLGQVPAAVAADHQPLAAVVHRHAAGRFHHLEIRSEAGERRIGIGRHDGHPVVRFEKIHYLVTTYRPRFGGNKDEHLPAGSFLDEKHRLVGKMNGIFHDPGILSDEDTQ